MPNYEIVADCQVENLNEILLKYFGYKNTGQFVEVGAYNGYNWGNTWGLAVAGWYGVYVEPIPEYANECIKNHEKHNVNVIQAACSDYTGISPMLVAGSLSSFDPLYINSKVWGAYYNKNNEIEVAVDTLDNMLVNQTKILPGFDMLVVDAEGSEMKVLNGFDVDHWKPKMIIVEEHEQNENKEELATLVPQIESYLHKYEKIYSGFVNSIYVIK